MYKERQTHAPTITAQSPRKMENKEQEVYRIKSFQSSDIQISNLHGA